MHAILHEIGSTIITLPVARKELSHLQLGLSSFCCKQMEAEHKVETPHAKQTRTRRI